MEYKALLETSLQYLRCPICSALEDLEFSQLCKLQYDVTHDPVVRNKLAFDGGFCAFHFRRFRKLSNSQTNALMLQALVEKWLLDKGLESGAQCLVCRENGEHEEQLLTSFTILLSDTTFIERFRFASGLCFGQTNDFSIGAGASSSASVDAYAGRATRKTLTYIRKNDSRFLFRVNGA